jgi:hypothetical protein
MRRDLDTASAHLQLKPGTYRYKVRVYNVLNQLDSESPWQDLVVLKAELPGPKNLTPSTLYLEDPVLRFKVEGNFLVDGAHYRIYRQDKPEVSASAEVVTHISDQEVELTFPNFDFSYGDYNLTIENPGGLKHTLKKALQVRYEKPIDIQFSVGWTPKIILYDSWYKDIWSEPFYPLGGDARLTVIFLKKADSQVGAELEAGGWLQTGGIPAATIHSQYLLGGANLVYIWLLSKQLHLTARAGGGLLVGSHSFDYQGTQGAQWTSSNLYASGGLGATYFFNRFWHVDAGVDLINGFGNGYLMGLLQPQLSTGLSF